MLNWIFNIAKYINIHFQCLHLVFCDLYIHLKTTNNNIECNSSCILEYVRFRNQIKSIKKS